VLALRLPWVRRESNDMDDASRAGRFLFAIAMVCFGVLYFIYASSVAGPVPGPPWTPGNIALAWLVGLGLIATGVCIATGWQGRLAAVLLALGLFLRALLIHAPGLFAHLHDPGGWTSTFEVLALGAGALSLVTALPAEPWRTAGQGDALSMSFRVACLLFAISLVVFGVQHLMYGRFVATLVPTWIPWHVFWAYFVGVAFLAAAASIATGVMARMAAALLGIMFFLWVLILHAPRVAAAPHDGKEWTSLLVALAMAGVSFVLVGILRATGRGVWYELRRRSGSHPAANRLHDANQTGAEE